MLKKPAIYPGKIQMQWSQGGESYGAVRHEPRPWLHGPGDPAWDFIAGACLYTPENEQVTCKLMAGRCISYGNIPCSFPGLQEILRILPMFFGNLANLLIFSHEALWSNRCHVAWRSSLPLALPGPGHRWSKIFRWQNLLGFHSVSS